MSTIINVNNKCFELYLYEHIKSILKVIKQKACVLKKTYQLKTYSLTILIE